jgi:glycosyltransferase involved in cell wall biosynthesis
VTRELLIDLSRLVWRARLATPSGIDRVERAYARHFLAQDRRKVRFVARMGPLGARELPTEALAAFLGSLERQWHNPAAESDPAAPARLIAASLRFRRRGPSIGLIPSHQNWHRRDWLNWLRGKDGRLVLFLHDTIPADYPEYARKGGAERHRERLAHALGVADGFVVNSAATGEALAHYCPRKRLPVPLCVAPIGLDRLDLAPAASAPLPRRPWFLCLGTIEPRKNHLLLLHVWRRLAETMPGKAPALVVVGRRGWENENIVDLLERGRGLAGLVHEHNALGDAQLAALLKGAQALLMPSFAEGFGMPVSEALAAGVPVIASDLAVYRESAGEVPLYLDPLDGPGWLKAVLDYAEPGSKRRQAQLKRLQKWSPPSWEDHFARVEDLLERLDK